MKTILIVDHVASQRELLVTWLKDDYTVCTAADGATGLALAAQTEPDLIFLALALPDSDGGEVARCIKAQARLRDIPLIALTDQAMCGGDISESGCRLGGRHTHTARRRAGRCHPPQMARWRLTRMVGQTCCWPRL